MSDRLVARVARSKHPLLVGSPAARDVLVELAACVNAERELATGDRIVWPSRDELAAECQRSTEGVRLALRALEAAGLVRDTGARKGSTGQVVVYEIQADELAGHTALRTAPPQRSTVTEGLSGAQRSTVTVGVSTPIFALQGAKVHGDRGGFDASKVHGDRGAKVHGHRGERSTVTVFPYKEEPGREPGREPGSVHDGPSAPRAAAQDVETRTRELSAAGLRAGEIARTLNAEGLTNPRARSSGGTWTAATVLTVLRGGVVDEVARRVVAWWRNHRGDSGAPAEGDEPRQVDLVQLRLLDAVAAAKASTVDSVRQAAEGRAQLILQALRHELVRARKPGGRPEFATISHVCQRSQLEKVVQAALVSKPHAAKVGAGAPAEDYA